MKSLRLLGLVTALAVTALSGCKRDVQLPDQPQRGKAHGVVDTQGHIDAVGNPVVLVSEDGARATQTTAADGSFAFDDLLPGAYYLDVSLPGFAPFVLPNIRIVAGGDYDAATLKPAWLANTPSEAVVTGKVVVNPSGDPHGGQVDFRLQPGDHRVAIATIGLDGTFVQRVPPGTYQLKASNPLFTPGTLDAVVVPAGADLDLTATPLVLGLNPATLVGSVTRQADGPDAGPAVGAAVTLGSGETTTTDSAGNYRLEGLAAGQQTVRFTLTDYHDLQDLHATTLAPGKTTALDPVKLKVDRGAISGTVLIGDGQAATDVTVAVTGTGYSTVATPDPLVPAQGLFTLQNVPVGFYEVSATKSRYSRAVVGSVHVTQDGVTPVGQMTLTLLQGDFVITGGDPTTPGFTRVVGVTLNLSGFTGAATYRASESPSFAGASYGPFTTNQPTFNLSGAQGTHVVYAQYKDGSGTESPVFHSSIIFDDVPPAAPTVQINGGAAFTNTSNPLYLTLQAQETLSPGVDTVAGLWQVLISETGALSGNALVAVPVTYQRDYAYNRVSPADGVQNLWVQFKDHAGNLTTPVQASITVDTVRPTGSLSIAAGAGATAADYTNSALVTLAETAAAEPDGGYVNIRLANSQAALNSAVFQPVSSSAAWFLDPAAGDTLRTVYAQLQDAAGNLSLSTLTATIHYDHTPPSPISASLVGPATTNDAGIVLNVAATDAQLMSATQGVTASESVLLQGTGTVGPMGLPVTSQLPFILSPGDGNKVVYVRFRDAAGNDATTSVNVTLDTQPPTGSFTLQATLPDGTFSSAYTASIGVKLLISQTGATLYYVGDENLAACPALPSYAALTTLTPSYNLTSATSPRQVKLCLADAAGNALGPLTQTITYLPGPLTGCTMGLTGTKVDGVTAAPPGKTGLRAVTANIANCSPAPVDIFLTSSSVACSSSASFAWQPYSAAAPFSLAGGDGTNTVQGCVRDAAHNVGSLPVASIWLQTQPPTAARVTLDNGAPYVNLRQIGQRSGFVASVAGFATGAVDWSIFESGSPPGAYTPYATNNPQNKLFGGNGLRTLYALFRDDVGNVSPAVSASITFDDAPPDAGPGTAALTVAGNGYTNSVSVQLSLTAPSDATQVLLAQAGDPSACDGGDMLSTSPRAVAPGYVFLTTSGDGVKRVCAQLLDAAGNPSSFLSGTVTLDTQPPSQPVITTPPATFNIANAPSLFTVTTSAAPADPSFARYEIQGGAQGTWADAGTDITTNVFLFTLLRDNSLEAGIQSTLKVRAVDLAGNASSEGSVAVTVDTNAPGPVVLNTKWVDNGSGQVTLFWQPNPVANDVVGYDIYYGPSSASNNGTPSTLSLYTGENAMQGGSPIRVGPGNSAILSGLTNGSPTFATVVPIDAAGNPGTRASYPGEVQLQPNVVSPNLVADVATSIPFIRRLAVYGHYAFAFGPSGGCGSSSYAMLQVFDLSTLVSPVQGGQLGTGTGPTAFAATTFPELLDCTSFFNGTDMAIDGNYLFTVSGTYLRIFNLAAPSVSPLAAAVTLNLSPAFIALHSVSVRGTMVFVVGRNGLVGYIDISSLFDGSAATRPVYANLLGTALSAPVVSSPAGVLLSRDKLLEFPATTQAPAAFNTLNAINGVAWGSADYLGPLSLYINDKYTNMYSNQVASGNLLYNFQPSSFQILDLNPLWTSTVPYANHLFISANGGVGQHEVQGSEVFLNDSTGPGVRSLDVSDVFHVADTGLFRFVGGLAPSATVGYGNYLLVARDVGMSGYGHLQVLEAATPRSLHPVSNAFGVGPRADLVPGMLYSANGFVSDLAVGSPPPVLNGTSNTCSYDSTRFDDVLVSSLGTMLRFTNLDSAIDRNWGTPAPAAADIVDLNMAAGVRVTAVEAVGNYLVAAEVRSAPSVTTGIYLEVFDARKLRDRKAATTLLLTDSVGSFQVSPYTSTYVWADLSMEVGRALVTVDDGALGPNPGGFIVDLRPLLDDDAATVMVAAGSANSSLQGSIAGALQREGVLRGNFAYVTTNSGLMIANVAGAVDEFAATTALNVAPIAAIPITAAESLAVYGSYAVVTPLSTGATNGITVVDVSSPASPQIVGFYSYVHPTGSCLPAGPGEIVRNMRSSTIVRGSRLYVTSYNRLDIFELE